MKLKSPAIETSYLPEDLHFKIVPFEEKVDYDSLEIHRHDYIEIFLFQKASGTHLIDFNEYNIKDNDLHFVFPGQIHLVKRTEDSQGFVILFKADFLRIQAGNPMQEFHNRFFNKPVLSPAPEENEIIQNIFNLLKNEFKRSDAVFNDVMTRYYLNALLIHSLRYQIEESSLDALMDEEHLICNQFQDVLEEHFTEQLSLDFYQDKIGVNYKKLQSATQLVFGKSPKKMAAERLNLEIRRNLIYSLESIKEIAYKFNFKEPSHLTKFFSRMNNDLSPNEFRSFWDKKYKP